jgi:methylglyoxal synthase
MARTIALIAHDRQKDAMINFAIEHAPLLARYHLIATEGTGELIRSATKLKIECLESGLMGGDIQIANLEIECIPNSLTIFAPVNNNNR